nr:extensin-like [Procambarus clarkii]
MTWRDKKLNQHVNLLPSITDPRYPDNIVQPKVKCFKEGVFPHPRNCSWFYRCVDRMKVGFYNTYLFECGPGTVFADGLDQCVFPFMTAPPCGTRTGVPPNSTLTPRPPLPSTLTPSPSPPPTPTLQDPSRPFKTLQEPSRPSKNLQDPPRTFKTFVDTPRPFKTFQDTSRPSKTF